MKYFEIRYGKYTYIELPILKTYKILKSIYILVGNNGSLITRLKRLKKIKIKLCKRQ